MLSCSLAAPKSVHKKSVISLPWKRKPKSKGHRVFGAPLDLVIVNNELPELLQVKHLGWEGEERVV